MAIKKQDREEPKLSGSKKVGRANSRDIKKRTKQQKPVSGAPIPIKAADSGAKIVMPEKNKKNARSLSDMIEDKKQ